MLDTLGTWNIRSMYQGKLDIVKREMIGTGISILGISELCWTGLGHFQSDEHKVFYSGNESVRRNGVAFICSKQVANSVLGYNPVNDRIISLRIQGRAVNSTVIQVYAPTTTAEENITEDFYNKLQETIDNTPSGDILI